MCSQVIQGTSSSIRISSKLKAEFHLIFLINPNKDEKNTQKQTNSLHQVPSICSQKPLFLLLLLPSTFLLLLFIEILAIFKITSFK